MYNNPFSCKSTLARFYRLDQHDPLPWGVRFHLHHCRSCSDTVHRTNKALAELQTIPETEAKELDLTTILLPAIQKHPAYATRKQFSLWQWLSPAVVLLGSMILQVTADPFNLAKETFGVYLQIGLPLAIGCILSLYLLVFVISHHQELQELLHIDTVKER